MRTPSLGFVRLLIISLAVATIGLVGAPPQVQGFGAIITVNTTADDETVNGNCTLREAIVAANTNANVDQCVGLGGTVNDLIMFSVGTGTPKITIGAVPLPVITQWVVIDGNTGGATRVEISGPGGFVSGSDGLEVAETGAGTEIHSMVINNSADDGILILADQVTVVDSYIGLDATGTVLMSNGGFGIQVRGNGDRIGQFDNSSCNTCDRNVIAGSASNKAHILIDFDATGAFVRGNYIGTDATGTVAQPSSFTYGIIDKGIGTLIGGVTGTTPGGACTGDCNVIAGNQRGGIFVEDEASQARILGNFIGIDVTGTQKLTNGTEAGSFGIGSNSPGLQIGNGTPEGRNVVSGIAKGLTLSNVDAVVEGNYIGTNSAGTTAIASSGIGVNLTSANGATIGGTTVGAGNLISGANDAGSYGVFIYQSVNNRIIGNLIGTAIDGVTPLGNGNSGVFIGNESSNNIVGGITPGSGNTIAFNGFAGVEIDAGVPPARANSVRGNSIYSNGDRGIRLDNGANDAILPPVITGTNPVMGTACIACIVEVFSDLGDEGRIFEGTTIADGGGSWTYFNPVTGPNITATNTDNSTNTSEFSVAVPGGSATPTPTPPPSVTSTPEPTDSPTSTPTATPDETVTQIWGDMDCNGTVGARDNQQLLRYVLEQPPLSEMDPCPGVGGLVSVDGTNREWGDNDCNEQVGSRDHQALLRFVLGQNALSQTEPCPDIGDEVEVGVARV